MNRFGYSLIAAGISMAMTGLGAAEPPSVKMAEVLGQGAGRFHADLRMGVATLRYNEQARRELLTNSERHTDMATVFEGRAGLGWGLEGGLTIPFLFNIAAFPSDTGLPKQSAGGVGDIEAWMKWQFFGQAPNHLIGTLLVGAKLPTGRWLTLDTTLSATEQIGTGTSDLNAGMLWLARLDPHRFYLQISYRVTIPRLELNLSGTEIRVDLGDTTSAALAWEWDVSNTLAVGIITSYQNTSRTRQDDVRIDQTDSQWLTIRGVVDWLVTSDVGLVPYMEIPIRGTNHLSIITYGLMYQQRF